MPHYGLRSCLSVRRPVDAVGKQEGLENQKLASKLPMCVCMT